MASLVQKTEQEILQNVEDDTNDAFRVNAVVAFPAGTNLIGRVNVDPQTANGCTIYRLISAATTNAQSVKASAGQVYTIHASCTNATARFLKLYNKASAPTVGTDTPVMTIVLPGATTGTNTVIIASDVGATFSTGIALAITAVVTDADATAILANEVIVHLFYK